MSECITKSESSTSKTTIVCKKCGAEYAQLPAFTCPRCGNPLCSTGCDGCSAKCANKDRR